MINRKHLLQATFALSLSAGSAFAAAQPAILHDVSGKVMIKDGNGVTLGSEGLQLLEGQSIYLGTGGKASVSMGECTVLLSETAIFTVPEIAPCAVGEAYLAVDGIIVQPVADLDELYGDNTVAEPPPPPGEDVMLRPAVGGAAISPLLISGGVVAAATVALVASATLDEEEVPVSAP